MDECGKPDVTVEMDLVPEPAHGLNAVQSQQLVLPYLERNGNMAHVFHVMASSYSLPLGEIYAQFLRLISQVSRYPLFECIHDYAWLYHFPSEGAAILQDEGFQNFLKSKTFPKFTAFGEDLFADLKYFSDKSKPRGFEGGMPAIDPVKLPPYLVSGNCFSRSSAGSNIPPHNLIEVIDALHAKLQTPSLSSKKLLDFIRGPEFANAEVIITEVELVDAYSTGKSAFTLGSAVDDLNFCEHGNGCSEKNKSVLKGDQSHAINNSMRINIDFTVLIDDQPIRLPLDKLLQQFIEARLNVIQKTRKCGKRKSMHIFDEDLHYFKERYGKPRVSKT